METLIILAIALACFYGFRAAFPPNLARKSDSLLLREHTIHLHRSARAQWRPRTPFHSARADQDLAADELRRRGIDPEKAIAEKFGARRDRRPMNWDNCRIAVAEGECADDPIHRQSS